MHNRYPPAPEGVVLYAIGDIHGRSDLLARLHAAIDADRNRAPHLRPIEIYLGDYIDRGIGSANVIRMLMARAARYEDVVFLRGNHEQVFLEFAAGLVPPDHFLSMGAQPTLASYGMGPRHFNASGLRTLRNDMMDFVPPEHHHFLSQTSSCLALDAYFFVHAGIRPGVPLMEQDPKDLLWIRSAFLDHTGDHGCVVVHGHTPVPEPDFRPNRINIDTAAYATGRLTCLKISSFGPEILPVDW
jgi:serine/threonine protein phosphatase 1